MNKLRDNWPVDCWFLAIVALASSLFLSNSAFAQQLNWSFADHPQPAEAELTRDEATAIEAVRTRNEQSEPGKYCVEVPKAYFQIYQARYPAFSKIDTEAARYMAWKAHIVKRGMAPPATCILGDLEIRLIRSMSGAARSGFCTAASMRAHLRPRKKMNFMKILMHSLDT